MIPSRLTLGSTLHVFIQESTLFGSGRFKHIFYVTNAEYFIFVFTQAELITFPCVAYIKLHSLRCSRSAAKLCGLFRIASVKMHKAT